jgi:hypothetical protein
MTSNEATNRQARAAMHADFGVCLPCGTTTIRNMPPVTAATRLDVRELSAICSPIILAIQLYKTDGSQVFWLNPSAVLTRRRQSYDITSMK